MTATVEDTTYNGWKNYPTWAVHLWLDNEQGSQDACLEMAREAKQDMHPRFHLADALKQMIREEEPDDSSMFSDLLGYALDCVDWYEIADAYFEMIADEDDDETA